MSKNKMIALVIWFITLAIPFQIGFLSSLEPNFSTLMMFVLTLVGVSLGTYFYSKQEA
jgi:hypothetical protein